MKALVDPSTRWRRAVRVRGTVQGVGFRPAISRFATRLGLGGFVRNEEGEVVIEVEGGASAVARFFEGLADEAPAISRIDSLVTTALTPLCERSFKIVPSRGPATPAAGTLAASIPADLAPCDDCLRELDDPNDRRHRYPFINCTSCGPRFTIVRSTPYDRARTSMAPFALCAACLREYEDPADRRFHAEANACPDCGPTVRLLARGAADRHGEDALAGAAAALREGRIVAVKGAGGFLLAVDAANEAAVATLRARKRRPAKPLAVMVPALAALEGLVVLDGPARAALLSPARPIVVCPLAASARLAPSVAPGLTELGVFLPSTPLQRLLFSEEGGPPRLVMTSGNVSEEPIARRNDEAQERLADIADLFLVHNREIHTRADDSVVRVIGGEPLVLRRARGFVPEAIQLPFSAPRDTPVLALGAMLKATVCLLRGDRAVVSQHLGDLGDADSFAFFEETIQKLSQLADVVPRALVHDLHPDYPSSRWAVRRSKASAIPRHAVQHHHAHVASCLVEHGRLGPVIGVAFDGTGLGTDGTLWGGEVLLADLRDFQRLGHLRPLPLLGGEAAIREPWRLAVAALLDAGEALDVPALQPLDRGRLQALRGLWTRPLAAPRATGAGRWFDAIAALCGLCAESSYEGQAAVELEASAGTAEHGAYEFSLVESHGRSPAAPFTLDLRPTVRRVAADLRAGVAVPAIAARFHETLVDAIVAGCVRARGGGAPACVVLTGGCFQNRRLAERTQTRLRRAGFEVLTHRRVPCNDGGISLGQAAVMAYRLATSGHGGTRPCA